MIRNYFKIAWRSLLRNKLTTGLSLFGLVLGVACFLLLATYILNELRYDHFHEKADRIVFANFNYQSPSDVTAEHTQLTPTALVPVAQREFSEVEEAVRVYKYNNRKVVVENQKFDEKKMAIADASLFNIFSFTFIEGNPANALEEPDNLVLTRSTAKKYFGDEKALGRIVTINDKSKKVSGVIEDIPSYSTLKFDLVGSYNSSEKSKTESWSSANDWSFLLLKDAEQTAGVQKKLNQYIETLFHDDFPSGYKIWVGLDPLKRVHLHSQVSSGNALTYLYIFSGIAILLLLIACINFANLMTARSSERMKEIGIRKTLGAGRSNLMVQFLAESAIVTGISLSIGIVFAYLLLPAFSQFVAAEIDINTWNLTYFISAISLLFFVITVIAGAWPAFVLSKFRPVSALKGNKMPLGSTKTMRKSLVVFQFAVSIAFIMTTLVAKKQLYFIQHTDTGLDRSSIVMLDASTIKPDQLASFKTELLQNSAISAVTASYGSPVDIRGGYSINVAGETSVQDMSITAIPVEKDFISALGIKILSGTDFTAADEKQVKLEPEEERQYAFMLNEKAIKNIGLTNETAIGKAANINGRQGVIKAVLEDFNFTSLHKDIGPVAVFTEYDWFGNILIKTSGKNTAVAISQIENTWKSMFPDKTVEPEFLDDAYAALYKSEQRTTTILNIFSAITILVSCLGLFGLALFTATQRKKEIGIRKVLGASVMQVITILSLDFLKLVIIAVFIAAPVAWYAMNIWLQDFAFKINMPYGLFLLAGTIGLFIALITVSFQAIKAAIANPVKSLHTE
ncbi:FtsX-like permease family protein [Marixanthomonas ophiurae]|uniref:ABC transporter permease n=1 Tax=Marixanthomonas ophiurae TaxID=387659 RepID=A0A3E1QE03_9FLAO|nr:FtsX-like permease family protein [Marixanthomonas ophiurae]RFN60286.1 ABC transporter permease [Marixanthomonas ophiurae]